MAEAGTRGDALRRGKGRRKLRSKPDVAVAPLWWIAFSLGSLLIIFSGWVPVPYFYVVGLVLPIAVLIGYAYVGLAHTSSTDGHSQFADSIYYLGFIFTLITLAVALVYLATQENWDDVPLEQLIGRFGLALATTILGLAIRVATVNLSPTEVGMREDAERALLRSVENFRNHLENSSEAFRSITETHLDEIGKATQLSSELLRDHAKSTGAELTSAVGKVTTAMEESADAYDRKFRAKTAEMKFPDEILAERLSSSIEKITVAIDAMPAVVAKSLTSQRKIADQSEKVAERYANLEQGIQPLTKFAAALGNVGTQLRQMMDDLQSATQTIESRFSNSANRFDNLSKGMERLGDNIASLEQRIQELGKLSSTLEQNIAVARNHRQELESNLAASRQAVEVLHNELVAAARTVTSKLGR